MFSKGTVDRCLILWAVSRFALFVLQVLLNNGLHHLHWHIFTESLSIHTRGIPYFFLECAEHLWLFFLHFHQVSILIFQLLILSEKSEFSFPKLLTFLLWVFMVVLRKFICFSMILLNRWHLCCFSPSAARNVPLWGRLDGDEAAVTLIPALAERRVL